MFCFPPTYYQISDFSNTRYRYRTLSLTKGQISAEPAFAMGITLIDLAFETSLAGLEVKKASMFTFHFVTSHVKDCRLMIEPAHTNVHSEPPMYLLYRSSLR